MFKKPALSLLPLAITLALTTLFFTDMAHAAKRDIQPGAPADVSLATKDEPGQVLRDNRCRLIQPLYENLSEDSTNTTPPVRGTFVPNKYLDEFKTLLQLPIEPNSPLETIYGIKIRRCGGTCLADDNLRFVSDDGLGTTNIQDCKDTQQKCLTDNITGDGDCVAKSCAGLTRILGSSQIFQNGSEQFRKCNTLRPNTDNQAPTILNTCLDTGNDEPCAFATCGNKDFEAGREDCDYSISGVTNCNDICQCKAGYVKNNAGGCNKVFCTDADTKCLEPTRPFLWKSDCLCHSCPEDAPYGWLNSVDGSPKGINMVSTSASQDDSGTRTLRVYTSAIEGACKRCPNTGDTEYLFWHWDANGDYVVDATKCLSQEGSFPKVTIDTSKVDGTGKPLYGHIPEVATAFAAYTPVPGFTYYERYLDKTLGWVNTTSINPNYPTYWTSNATSGAPFTVPYPSDTSNRQNGCNMPALTNNTTHTLEYQGDCGKIQVPNQINCVPCEGYTIPSKINHIDVTVYGGTPIWYADPLCAADKICGPSKTNCLPSDDPNACQRTCHECPRGMALSDQSTCETAPVCGPTEYLGSDKKTCCPNNKLFISWDWNNDSACGPVCSVYNDQDELDPANPLEPNTIKDDALTAACLSGTCPATHNNRGYAPPTYYQGDIRIYQKNASNTLEVIKTIPYQGTCHSKCGMWAPYRYKDTPTSAPTCHPCPRDTSFMQINWSSTTTPPTVHVECNASCSDYAPFFWNGACHKCSGPGREVPSRGDFDREIPADKLLELRDNDNDPIFTVNDIKNKILPALKNKTPLGAWDNVGGGKTNGTLYTTTGYHVYRAVDFVEGVDVFKGDIDKEDCTVDIATGDRTCYDPTGGLIKNADVTASYNDLVARLKALLPAFDTDEKIKPIASLIQGYKPPTQCDWVDYSCNNTRFYKTYYDDQGKPIFYREWWDPFDRTGPPQEGPNWGLATLNYGNRYQSMLITRNPSDGSCTCNKDSAFSNGLYSHNWDRTQYFCSQCPSDTIDAGQQQFWSGQKYWDANGASKLGDCLPCADPTLFLDPADCTCDATQKLARWCHKTLKDQCKSTCPPLYSSDPTTCKCVCGLQPSQCTDPAFPWVDPTNCKCAASSFSSQCGDTSVDSAKGEECDLTDDIGALVSPPASASYKNICINCKVYRKVWCAPLPENAYWISGQEPAYYMKHADNCLGQQVTDNNDLTNYTCDAIGGTPDSGWVVSDSKSVTPVAQVNNSDPTTQNTLRADQRNNNACIYAYY